MTHYQNKPKIKKIKEKIYYSFARAGTGRSRNFWLEPKSEFFIRYEQKMTAVESC